MTRLLPASPSLSVAVPAAAHSMLARPEGIATRNFLNIRVARMNRRLAYHHTAGAGPIATRNFLNIRVPA